MKAFCLALVLVLGTPAALAQRPLERASDLEDEAWAAEKRDDYARAEALYREALAAGAESATLRYHLAVALVHLGRRDDARQEVERALTFDPSHVLSARLRDELSH